MKFIKYLLALAALTILPCAHAEDAPVSPPQPTPAATAPTTPGTPAPSSPAPSAAAPQAARKEDEEPAAWSLKRLGAYLKSKSTLSDAAAEKDKQIAALQARVNSLENGTELTALRQEAANLRADLEGFANYAQTHGLLKDDAAPQTALGQAAAAAVAGAVSTQLAALGVPASTLPPAAATPGAQAATLAEVEEQLKACKTARERQAILAKHRKLIMSAN